MKIVYRPLVVATTKGKFTEEERKMLRARTFPMCTDCATYTRIFADENGNEMILIFDFYDVKRLGFFQRIRHYLRKFKTAIAGDTRVAIIEL